jgi:hypothetical protein
MSEMMGQKTKPSPICSAAFKREEASGSEGDGGGMDGCSSPSAPSLSSLVIELDLLLSLVIIFSRDGRSKTDAWLSGVRGMSIIGKSGA